MSRRQATSENELDLINQKVGESKRTGSPSADLNNLQFIKRSFFKFLKIMMQSRFELIHSGAVKPVYLFDSQVVHLRLTSIIAAVMDLF